VKSCGLKPLDPNSGKMESIQIVLKLGETGESDRQNLNMRVSVQKNMRCGGKWGEWEKIVLRLELEQIYKQGTLAKQ